MNQSARVDHYRVCKDPKITVVIPSIPESSHETVIKCLFEQDFDEEYEILVVNDISVDLCEARNIGLKIANADIVAYIDDDCRPYTDWLSVINKNFSNETVCIEGAVDGGINYNGSRKYVGCNLAVDRNAALSIGGFRSEYDGWRDDTEFGWRMERDLAGVCAFLPDMKVTHPTRPRAGFLNENEIRLKIEYQDRYEDVMNNSWTEITYRKLQKYGIIPWINQFRYKDK